MKKSTFQFIFITLTMILISSFDGMIGVLMPSMKSEFHVENSQMSFVLFCGTLGFTVFTFCGGLICDRFGHKAGFSLGLLLSMISGLGIFFVNTIEGLACCSFLLNCGMSILTISANTSVSLVFAMTATVHMNIFHLFYSTGSAVSKKIAGFLLVYGVNWRYIYLTIAVASFLLIAVVSIVPFPSVIVEKTEKRISVFTLIKNWRFITFIFIVGCYLIAEGSTSVWMVNYIQATYLLDVNRCSTYLASFFVFSVIGKLVFTPFIQKIGEKKVLVIFPLLAAVFYYGGIMLGENGLWMIAGTGLFLSVLYPITLVMITKRFSQNSPYVLGIIVTAGSMIYMLVNLIIGNLNDSIGSDKAYYIIPTAIVLFSMLSFIVHKDKSK